MNDAALFSEKTSKLHESYREKKYIRYQKTKMSKSKINLYTFRTKKEKLIYVVIRKKCDVEFFFFFMIF